MKQIYRFNEGNADMKDLLGGKGANLAEMTSLGLPVPAGFTIATTACVQFLKQENYFEQNLKKDILEAIHQLENETGKSFLTNEPILLVSVRSGAKFSMPGMMDTILNLGLNDIKVKAFAKLTDSSFAYDCYRRLIQMFGDVVYGIAKESFDKILAKYEASFSKNATDFSIIEQERVIEAYKDLYYIQQKEFPQDPIEQLFIAIKAVFHSWENPRAKVYRQLHDIPFNLGTAVNIQTMVFGNSGEESATGVAFTRNPATGEKKLFGEFLRNAQGEDVVAGIRTPQPLSELKKLQPNAYTDFIHYAEILESRYRDMQNIEFTIDKGQLFILQTRNGKRTAQAALSIALALVEDKVITKKEALLQVTPTMVEQLIHPVFDPKALEEASLLAEGLPASPGAASGQIVFTAEKAKEFHEKGRKVVLVRQETSPEDIEGMVVSEAIVTSRGGMTSHAAVVARGMGTCCVAGCEALTVNEENLMITCDNQVLTEGDIISVDGSTGRIYQSKLQTVTPISNQKLQLLLSWADEQADLSVRTNAETLQDLTAAIDFGASGIGLARTEHMFFGENRILEMRRLILAEDDQEFEVALQRLLHFQQDDFYHMLEITNEKPMIVRLLDPPMHEFLPKDEQTIAELAASLNKSPTKINKQINQLHETNPMLGHRGCRLGITEARIYQMQVEAIFTSAIQLNQNGYNVKPEIMIPLIAEEKELIEVKRSLLQTIEDLFKKYDVTPFPFEIGTMIELPRACMTADQLAKEADFFSFGTNDLTQMTYGFSRDDIGKFLSIYKEKGILPEDPFQSLDQTGVGQLIQTAVTKARQTKSDMKIGVCGEVGGDPQSIAFFQQIGIDYVSCSAYRIPAARLACAQATLNDCRFAKVTL
ncbi:pyruvate, phosphate dikinase [Tetragenococcus halophilus]